jgi:hypothetical protein
LVVEVVAEAEHQEEEEVVVVEVVAVPLAVQDRRVEAVPWVEGIPWAEVGG